MGCPVGTKSVEQVTAEMLNRDYITFDWFSSTEAIAIVKQYLPGYPEAMDSFGVFISNFSAFISPAVEGCIEQSYKLGYMEAGVILRILLGMEL